MVSKTMKLVNAQGLHMRPAQMFAAEMKNFECDVNLECNPEIPVAPGEEQ